MIIRGFQETDIKELLRIHKQYESEFSVEEFNTDNYTALFSVEDEKSNQLITAGGIRLIPEIVMVTDKERSTKTRREALVRSLEVSEFIARRNNYTDLHAFVQDEVWLNQLIKHDFVRTAGTSLVFRIKD